MPIVWKIKELGGEVSLTIPRTSQRGGLTEVPARTHRDFSSGSATAWLQSIANRVPGVEQVVGDNCGFSLKIRSNNVEKVATKYMRKLKDAAKHLGYPAICGLTGEAFDAMARPGEVHRSSWSRC